MPRSGPLLRMANSRPKALSTWPVRPRWPARYLGSWSIAQMRRHGVETELSRGGKRDRDLRGVDRRAPGQGQAGDLRLYPGDPGDAVCRGPRGGDRDAQRGAGADERGWPRGRGKRRQRRPDSGRHRRLGPEEVRRDRRLDAPDEVLEMAPRGASGADFEAH